jgi:hypothetical protein
LLSFETFLTIRQNSLYVTVCMFALSSYWGYFIHPLSTLHYCISLAITATGLAPASVVQLRWTHRTTTGHVYNCVRV